MVRMEVMYHWDKPSRYAILLRPQQLLAKWALGIVDRKYYRRHPNAIGSLADAEDMLDQAAARLSHIGLQLVLISLATMAFFAWNYLLGLYGPT
jgi:hypothetical protein